MQLLGDRTSLESERGYHIMIDGARTLPRIPVVSGDHNVSITAMEGGLRMTTMAEFAAIDAPLDLKRPFLGILSAQECVIDIFSFPPHLGSPRPGIELGERRQNVRAPCALSR